MSKAKKPSVKSLERKLWAKCVEEVRAKGNNCISCGKYVTGKNRHTGHLYRKKFCPYQMKYDTRILFCQCSYCNRRLCGNLEYYIPNVIRLIGVEEYLSIHEDIMNFKKFNEDNPPKQSEIRDYYKSLLGLS